MYVSVAKASRRLLAFLLAGWVSLPSLAQSCEVKVGATGPMTGGAAAYGASLKAAVDFMAAQYNATGGLPMGAGKCRIKILPYDTQANTATAAAASNYFASESVHAVIGPVASNEVAGWQANAKRNKQVYFTGTFLPTVIGPDFPLAFHANGSPMTWGPVIARAVLDQFKFKSMMIVATNDQGGTEAGKQYVKIYGDLGVKVTEEYYQRGTTNFAPLVQRLMSANPDLAEISSAPPADQIVIVRQLREAGYAGVIGSAGGTGITPLLQGADTLQNLKNAYWGELSPLDHPGVVRMKQEYEQLMKAVPPQLTLFPVYVVATEQMLRGISLAGTDQDGDKIAEAMRKMTPESRYLGKAGWRGRAMYGVNQELSYPVGAGMVVDGRRLPVKTVEISAE
jgi:branched-chain amino acid transport system substrate-binding protein